MSAGLDPQYADMESHFKEVLAGTSVGYVSVRDLMCNADGCLTHVGDGADQIVSFDYGHFTTAGAAYVAKRLLLPSGHS